MRLVKSMLLAISLIALLSGALGFFIMINNVDVINSPAAPFLLILFLFLLILGMLSLLGYFIRSLVTKSNFHEKINAAVSFRQAFLISSIICLNLLLKGMTVWNIIITILIAGIAITIEHYFSTKKG